MITQAGMAKTTYELLGLFGCPEEDLIKIGVDEAVVCKTLYVPIVLGGVTPGYETYSVPAKLSRMLREMAEVLAFARA